MERIAVKSSNVASIGYDPATETLEVAFLAKDDQPERVYQYEKVPYDKYKAFLNAESPGSHFAINIRANYEGHRVDSDKKEQRHGQRKEEGSKAKED